MPGAHNVAYAMLPFRILAFSFFFTLMYPSSSSWVSCVLCTCALPARYLRVVVGTPSQILKFGAYPMPKQSKKLPAAGEDGVGLITTSHKACTHYPCQQLYSMSRPPRQTAARRGPACTRCPWGTS